MTTIREVADLAGVSYTTVSHVINNTRFVSEETRQKVIAAMQVLGYHPNALARSLRRGETLTLGLILPDSSNPFFAEVGHSIEDTAFRQGYSLILCNTEGDTQKEFQYVKVLCEKQVDGVIFIATGDQADSLDLLLSQEIPVVVIDRELPEVGVDAVLLDNYKAGYQATKHLLELGHRRIACLTGPSNITPSAQRVIGYQRALAEAAIQVEEDLIVRGDFHPRSGHDATSNLLKRPNRPTALFACNDLMAFGSISAAFIAGYKVPDDLAVVGCDDIELASYFHPPLTTIAQPKTLIGQTAIELILERIREPARPAQRLLLESQLIIRGSSVGAT